jgi:hypothetical protein
VIAFWAEVLENEKKKYSTAERLEASDRLMAYGFGKPPQAIEGHFTEARKQVLEVRWMPPDPNDHSKLIEPKLDGRRSFQRRCIRGQGFTPEPLPEFFIALRVFRRASQTRLRARHAACRAIESPSLGRVQDFTGSDCAFQR